METETLEGEKPQEELDAKIKFDQERAEKKDIDDIDNESERTEKIKNPFEEIKGLEKDLIDLISAKGGKWEKIYPHQKGHRTDDIKMEYVFGDEKKQYRVVIIDKWVASSIKNEKREKEIRVQNESNPTGETPEISKSLRPNSFVVFSYRYDDNPERNINTSVNIKTNEGEISIAQDQGSESHISKKEKQIYENFKSLNEDYLEKIKEL